MDLDYPALGLKCGLEVHQQLDTKKLFCNCPSLLRKDAPDFQVRRKLHAVAGESGEIDTAAKYQHSLDQEFVYEGYHTTTCLVELDEEPPHMINQQALKIGLQISMLLNCRILPISQIMRKTVVDGSNTSGFQRTVLIARDGFIETSRGKVGITSVCLEEDSARTVNSEGKIKVYRLDRLGIPLVEIATEPDIKTSEQAKEVALHIGEILRRCNVKRGLGTIRQDVNLSIAHGSRIELKGFQDIRSIETAIATEVRRQKPLVDKKKSVAEVRKVLPDGTSEFLRPMPGAARMYPETDLPLLKISRWTTDEVRKSLPETEREAKFAELSSEMTALLLKQKKVEEYKELIRVIDNPNLVAKVLLIYPKEIASHEKVSDTKVSKILTKDVLIHVLESVKKRVVAEENVKHVMEKIVQTGTHEGAINTEKINVDELEENVRKIIKDKPGLSANAYMGLVMKDLKGKISGKEALDIIQRVLK